LVHESGIFSTAANYADLSALEPANGSEQMTSDNVFFSENGLGVVKKNELRHHVGIIFHVLRVLVILQALSHSAGDPAIKSHEQCSRQTKMDRQTCFGI
jgi:hypothetical protein